MYVLEVISDFLKLVIVNKLVISWKCFQEHCYFFVNLVGSYGSYLLVFY